MKNNHVYHRVFVRLLIIAVFLTSLNATRMVGDHQNPDQLGKPNPLVQKAAATVGICQVFPQNNYWNTAVTDLPVHSLSDAWINSIGSTSGFHMDFGSGTWDGGPIGIPFNIVSGATTTKYTVDFYYPDESDPGPYPIPQNPNREWGSDHHILIVDTDDCKLYELYDASLDNGQWFAGSGAIWDLNSNALRPDGWTSADAAGLPILPGLVRYEEIVAGVIDHALRFTTDCTADYYIWPARHVAQYGSCATPVPFGARFRLKADYDITGFSPQVKIILQAMKTYGIVLADNGSPWYVSGAPDEGWNNDVLHELDVLTGASFEAVETAGMLSSWTFADVPDTYWAYQYIERLYNAGITGGCGTAPMIYCPSAPVTRAQMAVFILRGIHGSTYAPPVATGTVFADVSLNAFAAAWIEQFALEGITAGCGGGNYCPDQTVSRAQMAVFLLRGEHGSAYTPLAATGTVFGDVPLGSFADAWIEQLALEGITGGCGGGNYCPNAGVTRDQMAVFLVKAFNLP